MRAFAKRKRKNMMSVFVWLQDTRRIRTADRRRTSVTCTAIEWNRAEPGMIVALIMKKKKDSPIATRDGRSARFDSCGV